MSHVRAYEHRIARAASRFVKPEKIDDAMSSFAARLRDPKIASTLDALSAPHDGYADKVEEIARTHFENYAKQNPDAARVVPPVDVAAAARKTGLDWNG